MSKEQLVENSDNTKTDDVEIIDTTAEAPFEVAPERIEVDVKFKRDGSKKTHVLKHVFNGLPDRTEQLLLLREVSKKREDADFVQFIGKALPSIAKTHDRLLIAAEGYGFGDKKPTLDDLKQAIYPTIKRDAIQLLVKFDFVEPTEEQEADVLDLSYGDSEEVEYTAMQNGKLCRMKHVFKHIDPFALTDVGQGRRFKTLDGGGFEYDSSKTVEDAEALYDAHILRVEGYSFKGEPLQRREVSNWKRRVPLNHKLAAIQKLRSRIISTEKN